MNHRIFYIFLSVFLFLVIYILGYIGFVLSEIKAIGGSAQWGSVKVLLLQKAPDRIWISMFYKEIHMIKEKKESDRVDFYYSIIILGGDAFIYDAEAEAILYEYINENDKKILLEKLKNFIKTEAYNELSYENKKLINKRISNFENNKARK